MSIIDKICFLLEMQGKTQKDLCDFLGISNNRFTDWKSGRLKSYQKLLPQIAEFLGVSVEELLNENIIAPKEINPEKLLKRIEELSAERRISPHKAYIESGVGKNFKSNLNYANASEGKVLMLANYFGVSTEFLKGETDDRSSKTEKKPTATLGDELEEDVIIFHRDGKTQKRKFTKEQMAMFMAMVDAIPESNKDI